MQYVCLDTNAWIYLANGIEPVQFLESIKYGVEVCDITLLVPQVVIDEWHINKEVAIKSGVLKHFNEVSEGLNRIVKLLSTDNESSKLMMDFFFDEEVNFMNGWDRKRKFTEIAQKFKQAREEVEGAVSANISFVETLLNHESTILIRTRNEVSLKAAKFALEKKAPFLKKNSFADAVILFSFINYVEKNSIVDAVFITYNTDDFCIKTDKKYTLHPDLVPEFRRSGSNFYNLTGLALKNIDLKIDLEFIQSIRETIIEDDLIEEEQDFSEEFCKHCFHSIDFFKNNLDDQRIAARDVSPDQLEFEFLKDVRREIINELPSRISVGYCSYCETEYFICVNCNTLNAVEEETDLDKRYECSGFACRLPYRISSDYGRWANNGYNERYTILTNTKKCSGCSEEFWNDGLEDSKCYSCEEASFLNLAN